MNSKRLLCFFQPARRAAAPLIRGLGVDQNRAWKQILFWPGSSAALAYRCPRTPATARSVHINRSHVPRRAADAKQSKKTADIVTLIKLVLQYDTAGDPITGMRRPRRNTDKIALALGDFRVIVSPNTVGISLLAASTSTTSAPTPLASLSPTPSMICSPIKDRLAVVVMALGGAPGKPIVTKGYSTSFAPPKLKPAYRPPPNSPVA